MPMLFNVYKTSLALNSVDAHAKFSASILIRKWICVVLIRNRSGNLGAVSGAVSGVVVCMDCTLDCQLSRQ